MKKARKPRSSVTLRVTLELDRSQSSPDLALFGQLYDAADAIGQAKLPPRQDRPRVASALHALANELITSAGRKKATRSMAEYADFIQRRDGCAAKAAIHEAIADAGKPEQKFMYERVRHALQRLRKDRTRRKRAPKLR